MNENFEPSKKKKKKVVKYGTFKTTQKKKKTSATEHHPLLSWIFSVEQNMWLLHTFHFGVM